MSKLVVWLSTRLANLLQAISVILQVMDGIHKLLDPVSNITLNVCPGVPISIGP